MKRNYVKKISNWGNFPVVETEIRNASSYNAIKKFVLNSKEIIARGNGRCYGDASLGETIFSTKHLNKFISFDRLNGIIECESGVLLSEILEVIVPQGYFLYVTPGTKFVSIGGAIASDVHGKNHHVDGCFSQYVLEFKIMNAKGEVVTCSRDENSELFWSTVGGMGLTGIILSAKIKLKNIETSYIRQESIIAENLDTIFKLFEESHDWTYNVAWIDCLQKGKNIGKSILLRGEHAEKHELDKTKQENPFLQKKQSLPAIPFYFPGFILNQWTVKLFNYFYYKLQSNKKGLSVVHYESFFYPLDIVEGWNKIYGKAGFIQYQMVIPEKLGREGITEILDIIANSGNGSFLAVLKKFGKHHPEAFNSFPFEGYTLALDFKNNPNLPGLVAKLDAVVEKYKGRIYLTKDCMSKSSLTNYLKEVSNDKFVSLQHKRILNNR